MIKVFSFVFFIIASVLLKCEMPLYKCRLFRVIPVLSYFVITSSYDPRNHPCCRQEQGVNISLAIIIDAFEIYGHDITDKEDYLKHYQKEMLKIKLATDQYTIHEHVHVATDHLSRFITLHIKELKVLLIALDDVVDNMMTLMENHEAISAEQSATSNGGPVPMEFYMSQEYYCGKNVYLFVSESYSDIYDMGRGPAPYCQGSSFYFLGFVHTLDDKKYYLIEDPSLAFAMDNYQQGLECHNDVCIYRFPDKKNSQDTRDISTLPKAIVKCGLIVYKLPPLSSTSCIITSGSFILDFNIQGVNYRHHDYLLIIPNGQSYYTKEERSPLVCDHHVCEWNSTNFYGGPFTMPGEPGNEDISVPPFLDTERGKEKKRINTDYSFHNMTYDLEGCFFVYPPNYGSIGGISYMDSLDVHDSRFTCQTKGSSQIKGLYWYPQWMSGPPNHPYSRPDHELMPDTRPDYYPHEQGINMDTIPIQVTPE